jgi:multiple sugar transport system substrate-binding protein
LLAVVAAGCGVAGAADRDRLTLVVAGPADSRAEAVERAALVPFVWSHPGIVVQQQSPGLGELGRSPDVVRLDVADVPATPASGALLDLAPFLPRLGLDPGRYDSAALGAFRRGNAIYALPGGVAPIVLAYNKDLFDSAGMPYPSGDWTWEDFLHAAQQLTRDTDGDGHIDQWGTALERTPRLWIPWLWSGGGDVLCSDGRRATGCLDSPASIAALRWYSDWVTQPRVIAPSAAPRRGGLDNAQLFFAGKVAMLTVGHDWVPTAKAYSAARALRLGLVELPHALGAAPQTAAYTTGFAVPAGAPHRRLSVELAAYLTDSQAQSLRAAAGLQLPAVPVAAQAFATADTLGWESAFLAASRHGRVPWDARIARWPEVEALLTDLMDQLAQRRVDAAVATHTTAARLDQLLAGAPGR